MYRVIHKFYDLKDNNHVYSVGDTFPRDGVEVSDERIQELMSRKNKIGVKLIAKVPKKPVRKKPKEV